MGPIDAHVKNLGWIRALRGIEMSLITSILVQAIAGALGGNAAGGILKNINLGPIGNSITGALGGGIGGHLLQALIPALAGAAGSAASGFDIAAAAGQAVGGGFTGAIVHKSTFWL